MTVSFRDICRDLRFLLGCRPGLMRALFLSAAAALAGHLVSLPLWFLPRVFIQQHERMHFLTAFVAVAMAGQLLAVILRLGRGYVMAAAGEDLLAGLRGLLFSRLQHLSVQSIYQQGPGPFVQRLSRDVFFVRDVLTESLSDGLAEVIRAAVLVGAMLWLDWLFTGGVLLVCLCGAPAVAWANRKLTRFASRSQAVDEEVFSQLVDCVAGSRDIQSGCFAAGIREQFERTLHESQCVGLRVAMWAHIAFSIPSLMIGMLLTSPYLFASVQSPGREELGDLLTFVVLMGQALPVIFTGTRLTSELAMAAPSIRAVRDQIAHGAATDSLVPERSMTMLSGSADVCLRNISVGISGVSILNNVSLAIKGGEFTAVVGPSGAGKTTLLHALSRLIDLSSGEIRIGNVALQEYDADHVRKNVGLIPQDPFVFNCSIEENITLGNTDVDPAVVQSAIEAAQLQDLLRTDRGNGWRAGFLGRQLSAGERQRIALARVIVQNPSVVLCDEFTANVDARTRNLLLKAIRMRFGIRTRILVTHEMSVARGADSIVVLDRGRVVQAGSHRELIGAEGLYQDLCQSQLMSD